MSAGAPLASVTQVSARVTSRSPSAPLVLGALVAVAFVVRAVASLAHATPRLFPDEYIYAALSRSLGEGSFTIRGAPAAFPAFFEPLLAAPLWRLAGDDVELGYRLVQGLHAAAASLVAVAVYLLARRAGVGTGLSLAAGAVCLTLPAMLYVNFVTADALAWPIALFALAAGASALDRPTRSRQAAFLVLAVLATSTRVQYAVLPLAFLAGSLAVSGWRPARALRDFRFTLIALGGAVLLVVASGPSRVLGYYDAIFDLGVDPVAIGRWVATDTYLLAIAAGVVLVPGAALATGALARPRTRGERAVVSISLATCLLLLGEAALYATNGSNRFQERYLLAVLTLIPVLFVVGVTRRRSRAAHGAIVGVAVALALAVAVVPLSGYAAQTGKQDSPTLQAVARLEQVVGTGGASLAVALGVTVLVAAGAALAWRPGRGTWAALALAAATLGVGAVAAASFDRGLSARVVRTSLGPDPAWISRSGLENVDVLQTPFSNRLQISDQLFWNPNLTRILRMKDASEVDVYGSVPTRIARDGRIVAAGRVVRGPILVQEYASAVAVEDATLVGRHVSHSLWRPAGTPRIASLFAGRYLDGLMGPYARITVWPRGATARRTTLTVRFRLPADVPATTLEARGPGGVRVLPLAPDRWTTLVVPIAAIDGPVTVALRARRPFLGTDGRLLGARATRPVLVDHVPERSSRAPSVPITRS